MIVNDRPESVIGEGVTAGYLPMLGIPALHGRIFLPEDNPAPEVVLSYGLWSRLFGRRDVVGQPINVNSKAYTILGVMPSTFLFPSLEEGSRELWTLLTPDDLANLRGHFRLDPELQDVVILEKNAGRKDLLDASHSVVVPLSDRDVTDEILESCRAGDRDAIRVLYETYKDRVYSISLNFFHGDQAIASDITQQVFLKLISGIYQFKGESAFSTWLYRLVVNACHDAARRRKSAHLSREGAQLQEVPIFGSHEDEYARAQLALSVRAAVSALPPKFRMTVLLRYFDDLSYEQIAKVLHCSMGTVASRLSRGHRMLAEYLKASVGGNEMKMFHRHISHQLTAHIDRELGARDAQSAELHLAQCQRCRGEHEQVQFGMAMLDNLPTTHAPDAIWTAIEAALPRYPSPQRPSLHRWRVAFAYLAIVAVAGAAYWKFTQRSEAHWEMTQVRGRPVVDSKPVRGAYQIEAGEWIETDPSSSATVKIGKIGSVEIAPSTRLLAVRMRSDEHRLALARGEIHAKISAPPKLFFVDTASGTAVDLGCEYSLQTNERGAGLLQVTKGWVSFQWKGMESLVPAGASCRTRPGNGPGAPYFDDAPALFKQAVESFATEKSGGAVLDTILSNSRLRDTLTLWHLLFRVSLPERKRIYDRIAALTPIPADVTREKVMKLDPETLTRWKDELAWTW